MLHVRGSKKPLTSGLPELAIVIDHLEFCTNETRHRRSSPEAAHHPDSPGKPAQSRGPRLSSACRRQNRRAWPLTREENRPADINRIAIHECGSIAGKLSNRAENEVHLVVRQQLAEVEPDEPRLANLIAFGDAMAQRARFLVVDPQQPMNVRPRASAAAARLNVETVTQHPRDQLLMDVS